MGKNKIVKISSSGGFVVCLPSYSIFTQSKISFLTFMHFLVSGFEGGEENNFLLKKVNKLEDGKCQEWKLHAFSLKRIEAKSDSSY